MGIGGFGDKAKEFLDSEQGEQRSDQGLEKAEQVADDKTGGKFEDQIGKGREFADEHIGQDDANSDG